MPSPLKTLQTLLGGSDRETRPLAIFVEREGGLGDVVMALAALHGLRHHRPEAKIYFHTAPRYQALAKRCPHVDGVFTDAESFQVAMQEHLHRKGRIETYELGSASYAINRDHETNAFLLAMGLHAPSEVKTPVVNLSAQEEAATRKAVEKLLQNVPRPWVLLHPAKGDRNRTWPLAHWNALIDRLLAEGCTPVVIGDNAAVPHKGVLKLALKPGVADLTNRLALLELLQLCRMADVLVSPDSGPVQLGALSDIGIVAIYTTVAPRCRLPFRRGLLGWRAEGLVSTCPDQGCYKLILKEDRHFNAMQAAVKADLARPGANALNQYMGTYCTQPKKPYACLEEVTPEQVWAACARLLDAPRHLGQAASLEAAGRHILAGEGPQALAAATAASAVAEGPETLQAEALALLLEGRIAESVERLKRTIARWPGAEALNLLGMILHLEGDAAQAERHFDLALSWNEAYAPALLNRALMKAAETAGDGQTDTALHLLDGFLGGLRELPEALALHVLPVAHAQVLRGWLILQAFSTEQALGCFEQALEAFPGSQEATLGIVECLKAMGRSAEAVARLEEALGRDPEWDLGRQALEGLRVSP